MAEKLVGNELLGPLFTMESEEVQKLVKEAENDEQA